MGAFAPFFIPNLQALTQSLFRIPMVFYNCIVGNFWNSYSREITHRLIGAIASKPEKSMIVTKEQYQLIDKVLFQPEEDIALHAENSFVKKIVSDTIFSSKLAKLVKFSKFYSIYVRA